MDVNDFFYAWKPALFRKKTRGMTTLQKGIYRELIDEYMLTREPLPANDLALADIARVSLEVWNENKDAILVKFDEIDGVLHHEHCNEELDFQEKNSKKKTKAGKKAALKRWEHKKKPIMRKSCDDDANAMRSDATGQDRTGQYPKIEANASRPNTITPEILIEAVNIYNAMAQETGLTQCQKLTEARKSKLRARLIDCGGLEGWKGAIDKTRSSAFLLGQNDSGWKAGFDFLLQEKSFTKLMEGSYDAKRKPKGSDLVKQQLAEWVDGR